jgi:SAM-dependent methyltransferase
LCCGLEANVGESFKIGLKRAVKGWLRRQSRPARGAALNLLRELKYARVSSRARARFRELEGSKHLKVHLGCGRDIRAGWLNVDLGVRRVSAGLEPGTMVIEYDLRRGLPLPRESCELIYSSHFLEHLDYERGVHLMGDCYRALQPGGRFRAALPDLRGLFRAYLEGNELHFDLLKPLLEPLLDPRWLTLVDYVNYGVYQFGEHKYIYDEVKLGAVLERVGFRHVRPAAFDARWDVDTPERRRYSFYVEALK